MTVTIQNMSEFAEVQAEVTEYIRDYIRALRRRKMSYEKIADRLQCSHVWVMQLDQPEKYGSRTAGPELEHRVADLLHGGSIDALRRAAKHFSLGGNVVVEDVETGGPLGLSTAPALPAAPNPRAERTGRRRAAK